MLLWAIPRSGRPGGRRGGDAGNEPLLYFVSLQGLGEGFFNLAPFHHDVDITTSLGGSEPHALLLP